MNITTSDKSLSRKIQVASHIAIITIPFFLGLIVYKLFFPTETSKEVFARNQNSLQTSNNILPNPIGKTLQLDNLDWTKNKRTLVLYISSSCHFCSESASFYQRVVKESDSKDLKLVAVLPQSIEEGREYLKKLNVKIDDVHQSSLDSIGVRGTPTLLLLNETGTVVDYWIGKLTPDREEQVIGKMKS